MTTFAAMTPEQRSAHMAKIRGRDTRPERLVQDMLVAADVQFRKHAADLPGTPDIVVDGARTVVFVHGCFWHRHGCRRGSTKVRKNRAFWNQKFAANIARDRRAASSLRRRGWHVMTVWECQTTSAVTLLPRLLRALAPDRRLCAHGPHVAARGRVLCNPCARYNRERIREGSSSALSARARPKDLGLEKRRAFLGLCRKCGLPVADGRKSCYQCCRGHGRSGRHAERIRDMANRGLCRCGRGLAPNRRRCRRCLKRLRDEAKARYEARAREGKCIQCSKKVKKGRLCKKHKDEARRRSRPREERSSRTPVTGRTSSADGTPSTPS